MALEALVIAGSSLISSALGASAGKSSAKKLARAIKEQAAVQREALQFAKDQFEPFRAIIGQFTDFFAEVPLSEIASGRVLARAAEPAISDINKLAEIQRDQFARQAGRRGLGAGSGVLGPGERQIERQRGQDIVGIRERTRRQEIEDRFRAVQIGLGLTPQVGAAFQSQAAGLGQQAQLFGQQQASAAGQVQSGLSGIGSFLGPLFAGTAGLSSGVSLTGAGQLFSGGGFNFGGGGSGNILSNISQSNLGNITTTLPAGLLVP